MKPLTVTVSMLGALFSVACGGSGDAAVSTNGSGSGTSGNVGALGNSEQPPPNDSRPPGNPDQSVSEAEQPISSGDELPTSSGGAINCSDVCQFVGCVSGESDGVKQCISECLMAVQAPEAVPCFRETLDALDCIQGLGLTCDEIRALSEGSVDQALQSACASEGERLSQCYQEQDGINVDIPRGDPPTSGPQDQRIPCPDGSGTFGVDDICDGFPDCDDGTDEQGC